MINCRWLCGRAKFLNGRSIYLARKSYNENSSSWRFTFHFVLLTEDHVVVNQRYLNEKASSAHLRTDVREKLTLYCLRVLYFRIWNNDPPTIVNGSACGLKIACCFTESVEPRSRKCCQSSDVLNAKKWSPQRIKSTKWSQAFDGVCIYVCLNVWRWQQ